MQSKILLFAVLIVSWIAAVESTLLLAGLLALKGAAIVGYRAGRYHRRGSYGHRGYYGGRYNNRRYNNRRYRHGRSVLSVSSEQSENILLSTVGELDDSGCILKLLCDLQFKEEVDLTLEENVLMDMFNNNTETVTAYNAAFMYATDIGLSNQDPAICDKYYSQCPMTGGQLRGLLQQAWGCSAFDLFGDDTQEPQQDDLISQQSYQDGLTSQQPSVPVV